jgi:hypothetical protein
MGASYLIRSLSVSFKFASVRVNSRLAPLLTLLLHFSVSFVSSVVEVLFVLFALAKSQEPKPSLQKLVSDFANLLEAGSQQLEAFYPEFPCAPHI